MERHRQEESDNLHNLEQDKNNDLGILVLVKQWQGDHHQELFVEREDVVIVGSKPYFRGPSNRTFEVIVRAGQLGKRFFISEVGKIASILCGVVEIRPSPNMSARVLEKVIVHVQMIYKVVEEQDAANNDRKRTKANDFVAPLRDINPS